MKTIFTICKTKIFRTNIFDIKIFILIIIISFSYNNIFAQDFQQQFGSGSALSNYNAGGANQFNAISTSGGGMAWTVPSAQLRGVRTGNAGAATRTTNLSGIETANTCMLRLKVTVASSSGALTNAASFYIGKGFTTANGAPANADVHAKFALNFTATSGQFVVRDISGSTNGATTYSGQQTLLLVTNNSGSSITYKAPDGTYESVANDKWDLWVGTSKQLDERNATDVFTSNSISDFKILFDNGSGTIDVDDILIDPVPVAPTATAATSVAGTSFTANWGAVSGATGYRLDVSTSNTFASFVSGYNDLAVAGTSQSVTGLSAGVTYYFRVRTERAYTVATNTSNHSNIITTTTISTSVPTLTTPTVSSITNTSATLGATISSDGGSTITARGTSYKTSSPVIATDNQLAEGGTIVAAYSHSRTSLSPQTQYYFAGYATNGIGTALSSESNFRTLSNPPDNQAANLIASASSSTQIDLSWDAAVFPTSGATTKGYVLIRATNPSIPTLSSANGTAPSAGVGTIVSSTIIDPTNTYSNTTGLSASTTYNYLLVPYCWDGTNASTYNYLTALAPTATATTPAGSGCTTPTPQASSIIFSSVTSSSMTISWTAGGGDRSLVYVRASGTISATPVNGTAYTASATFGSGDNVGSFTYACYAGAGNSFSLSNLSASTTYYVAVFTYTNSGNCYNSSSPATNSQATSAAASIIETFEPGTKAAYSTGNAVCNLGNWNFNDALIGNTASDRKNGSKSARIQNTGTLTMLFDKVNGLGTISIKHALYGSDANSTWRLDVSDNSGASFSAYQSAVITTSSITLNTQNFTVNVPGNNIRIRITKLSGGGNRLNIDDISMGDFVSANTITTGTITGSPYCISNLIGTTVSVPFTATGIYNSLNVYTAQLSDGLGSFATPTDIGTLASSSTSGTITATIPAATPNGSSYRIRVISSDPVIIGTQNSSNLAIVLNAPDLTNLYGTVASGTSVNLGWTVPSSCFDEILIIGKASSIVTAFPTGNGSLYTANSVFSTGGSGANLAINEYAVFKASSGTSVTITGLTTGTTYFFKAFTRKGVFWSDGVILSITPLNVAVGDFQTSGSGTYTTVGIWQTWNGSSWVAASNYPNASETDGGVTSSVSVTIKSGHTVTLNSSRSNQPIKNLTVESGGKIWTNDSTANGNRYLTIYGDIFCTGNIGNLYNKYDNISFNMEGTNQTISGTGNCNGSRIRKIFNTNTTTNLIIAMNVSLKFNSGVSSASGTELYNNASGSTFNMTLNENTNLNLLVSTGTSGNISIDGIDGEGSGERGGTFTINGTLTVPGTLFAFTDNTTRPIAYIIGTSGIINCVNVCTGNTASSTTAVQNGSAAAGCTLRILFGGKLNLTGGSPSDLNTYNKPFSRRSNTLSPYTYTAGLGTNNMTYDFQAGSTVEYSSGTGTMPVQSSTLVYSNLLITGGANKTINSTLDVNNNLTIQSPAILNCSGNNITVGGDWDNYNTSGFTEGTSATVTFDGTSAQHIYCPGGENFYNVTISNSSANGVELNCDAMLANDLDLGSSGRLFFGATPNILMLSKMTASSNTFKGSGTALVDMSTADHTLVIGCETPGYSGTFSAGLTSLVSYNRTDAVTGTDGNQDILTNLAYANLTLTGTNEKRTNNNFTVNSNLLIDGPLTVLKANVAGKSLTIQGNITLNNLATMDDNCRDNLEILTSGNLTQFFNGGTKTIKCFNLKSTKTAGGINLSAGIDQSQLNIKNDFALNYTGTSLFIDNANLIKVGDDVELGSATSTAANFILTGTLRMICDGTSVSTDSHISDFTAIDECKAHLNNVEIDPELTAIITQVDLYPTSGTKNIFIDGNLSLLNTNTSSTQFKPYTNTINLKGNWSTFNHSSFQALGSKVIFNSSTSAQTIDANGDYEVFYNLEINNANGVSILDNTRVSNQLIFNNGLINTSSFEMNITSNNSSSVTGQSLASYLNGNLRRSIGSNGIYHFPLGTATNYELATLDINSQSGITNILGFFTSGLPSTMPSASTCTIISTPINNMLNAGYWTLTPDAYTSANYDITLNLRGYSNAPALATQTGVIKRTNSSSPWLGTNLVGNNGTHTNTTQSYSSGTAIAKRSSVTSFSDFGIGFGANVLPIQLTTFEVSLANTNDAQLHWSTSSELNNNYFAIEKSLDALNFDSIGMIIGNGTSIVEHDYYFDDKNVKNGTIYYRIKQVDFDGTYSYSYIRSIEIVSTASSVVSIYPNPTHDIIEISISNKIERVNNTISVFDISGRKIISFSTTNDISRIDLSQYASGAYFLVLNNEKPIKIFKQ
jgi:hypothetical protein